MAKRHVTVELIVRRGARRRFQQLREKTAGLPVKVSWDRRRSERRTASQDTAPDRRRSSERRRGLPFTWRLSDFLVLPKVKPVH